MSDKPQTDTDARTIRTLTARMRSRRADVREAAAWELVTMGPAAIDAACHRLEATGTVAALAVAHLLLVAALVACLIVGSSHTQADSNVVLLAYFGVVAANAFLTTRSHWAWQSFCLAVAASARPGTLGSLIVAATRTRSVDRPNSSIAAALDAADREAVDGLGERHWRYVRLLMTASRNHLLVAALLRLCERAGRPSDLRSVRWMKTGRRAVYAPASVHPSVNEAAERAEEAIRARAAEMADYAKLVRPARPPDDQAATLLRPARGVVGGDEDRLPRLVGMDEHAAPEPEVQAATQIASAD